MENDSDYRFLNEDEILMGCKIKLESDRTVSVGKFINTYARLNTDKELIRKIHARLLESKKYTESHEIDKYGFSIIKYSNKKSFKERNPSLWDFILIVITALLSILCTLIATRLVRQ